MPRLKGGAYIPHFGMCAARRMQSHRFKFEAKPRHDFGAVGFCSVNRRTHGKENLEMATGSRVGSAAAWHQPEFFPLNFVFYEHNELDEVTRRVPLHGVI